jgi:hypothetical protein
MPSFNVTDIEPILEKTISEQKQSLTDIGKISHHKMLKIYTKLFEMIDIEKIREIAREIN